MTVATRSWGIALLNWGVTIGTLLPHLLSRLTRGSKMGFLLYLLEPLLLVTAFYVLRGVIRESVPNYGTSLFLFYASGLLPFYIFLRISSRLRSVSAAPNSVLPGVGVLDSYIAASLLAALINITMTVVIFLGMWIYGIDQARPATIVDCAAPLLLLIVLGIGVGMINNVIGRHLSFWHTLYATCTRGLLFLSGVIFIVDLTPPWLRAIVSANPLSHGVEWFRLGVYGRYPHNSLDMGYLIECSFIALFLGFVIDRATIRWSERR